MTRILVIPALCAALLLGGCYTLGETKPSMMKQIETLSVPVSKNTTLEPNVEAMLADSIIKQVQSDGTYAVNSKDRADAIVYTTLKEIERKPSRSVRGNIIATSEYLLVVTIDYRVVEQASGRVLMSGTVHGQTSFFTTPDLQTAEAQAMPLAFNDAAVRLTSRLSEGF